MAKKLKFNVTDANVIAIAQQVAKMQADAFRAGTQSKSRMRGDYNRDFWVYDFDWWAYEDGAWRAYTALVDSFRKKLLRKKV